MEEAHTESLGETGAQTRVMFPQGKQYQDNWQPPELRRQLPEGSYQVAALTADFQPQNLEEINSQGLKPSHLSSSIIHHYSALTCDLHTPGIWTAFAYYSR